MEANLVAPQKLTLELPYDLVILLLRKYPKEFQRLNLAWKIYYLKLYDGKCTFK